MKHLVSTPIRMENLCGGVKAFYEADGTRYTAWRYKVEDFKLGSYGYVKDGWLVITGMPSRGGYLFQKSGFLHWAYIMEKFHLNQCDAENLTYVIGMLLDRPTEYEVEESEE